MLPALGQHHRVARPQTRVHVRHLTLDREELEQPLASVDRDVLVQERPAAEPLGQDDRHVLTRCAYAFALAVATPLVGEEASEPDSDAFGIADAALTASI